VHNGHETDKFAEDESSPGLKVPDNEVEAVARENATDELASGEIADDRAGRLDEEEGVDVEVREEVEDRKDRVGMEKEETESERGERLRKAMSGKLNETSAEAKFRRGEDVNETDFETVDAERAGDGLGDGSVAESESQTTADRIRERVEWHRGQREGDSGQGS
jgi:hypothetical protein